MKAICGVMRTLGVASADSCKSTDQVAYLTLGGCVSISFNRVRRC